MFDVSFQKSVPQICRYTCEFNITQYGEDSMTDLAKYSDQERRESVKDILNLELVAHLESITPPNLPGSQEAAKKFQKENLTAAVSIPLLCYCIWWDTQWRLDSQVCILHHNIIKKDQNPQMKSLSQILRME
jgi:hypothetical protein